MSESFEADTTRCPGCGLELRKRDVPATDRYNASAECWHLYGKLTSDTISRGGLGFAHQLCVDAYGAQHSGGATKPITTAFALIGLYLAVERDFTGRQVQSAHMLLGEKAVSWPELTPPSSSDDITVRTVLNAETGDERDLAIEQWTESVWRGWEREHDWVKGVCDDLLDIDR